MIVHGVVAFDSIAAAARTQLMNAGIAKHVNQNSNNTVSKCFIKSHLLHTTSTAVSPKSLSHCHKFQNNNEQTTAEETLFIASQMRKECQILID
mmetsp:Transcript_9269/g.16707  ORF Transcript_9269/g.16707 Transcript_9269/m.16707 type:complete len:94 (+) Transcript_9269:1594-1875(+)